MRNAAVHLSVGVEASGEAVELIDSAGVSQSTVAIVQRKIERQKHGRNKDGGITVAPTTIMVTLQNTVIVDNLQTLVYKSLRYTITEMENLGGLWAVYAVPESASSESDSVNNSTWR